jgi:catechol 2,3-dioxygenase-like lactoylglutathione lyase family enzyme
MTTIGISIDVQDVDRAVDFYRDALGLRVIEKGDSWATMALGEQTFFFGLPWGPEGRIERDHKRHWTPVHLDFVVDDFDSTVERALGASAKLDRPVLRRPDLGDMANMSDLRAMDSILFSGLGDMIASGLQSRISTKQRVGTPELHAESDFNPGRCLTRPDD